MVKKIQYRNFALAFVGAVIIFFGGLFLGGQLTSWQVRNIKNFQEELKTSLTSLELQQTLLKQNVCGVTDFGEFSGELGALGRQLANLEARYSKGDLGILRLKEPYFLLQIRHYLLMQEAKSRCGTDVDLVLYFYSNNGSDCPSCDDQGYVLSYLQEKVGSDKLRLYSFDVRSSSPAVMTLADLYNVDEVPMLVINGRGYNRPLKLQELVEILGLDSDILEEAQVEG